MFLPSVCNLQRLGTRRPLVPRDSEEEASCPSGLLPVPLSLHHPNGPLEAPPRVLTSALVAEQTVEGPEVIANQMLLVGRGWTRPA